MGLAYFDRVKVLGKFLSRKTGGRFPSILARDSQKKGPALISR